MEERCFLSIRLILIFFLCISHTLSLSAFDSVVNSEKEFNIRHNSILSPKELQFMTKYGSLFGAPPVAEIFLTKGDSEDTISLNADSSGEIVITEEMVHNGTQYNHVVLACNSSYPVEWVYEGDGAPRLYTTQIRTFGNFHDPATYGHSNIVVLFQERFNEQQTGSYFCQSVHKPQLRVGFQLYFTGEFGFPSMDNRVVEAEDSSTVVIPCATSDPRAKMELHKIEAGGQTTNLSSTSNNLIHYDPSAGFILRPSDFQDPWGEYKCRTNGMDSGWKIDLLEPASDIVRVYPHTDVVHMENFSNHTFMCKAREPVIFSFPNTINFGTTHYLENPADIFPYIAVLRITSHVPIYTISNYFKINCISKKTRRVLHSWEYSSFGPDQVSISFEREGKRLLCCSKSGLTPRHELARCETDTDCSIKQQCFQTGRCDYHFPPKFVDAPSGCQAVDLTQEIPSLVVKCSVGKYSRVKFMTSNVENSDVILYDRDVNPPTDQILKIVLLGQQGNRVDIQCLGSLFFFSTNLVFAYEKNGSLFLADDASIQDVNSYGPILHMNVEPDIARVYCFAPLTRSADWLNVSLPIFTVSGTPIPSTTHHPPARIITETRVSTSSSTSTSVRVMKISGRMRSRFSKKGLSKSI